MIYIVVHWRTVNQELDKIPLVLCAPSNVVAGMHNFIRPLICVN